MSNSKNNKASAESLSALEEALSLAEKELSPEEKAELARDPIALPSKIANDDKAEVGKLVSLVQQKPSNKALYISIALAILWVIVATSLSFLSNLFMTSHGSLTAFTLIFAPSMTMVAIAYMAYRASEMRLATRGLTEIALKLAEPEVHAQERLTNVGQAIRREVDAIQSGMTHALSLAGELEKRLHSELGTVEDSYKQNEVRLLKLIDDLQGHKTSLIDQSSNMQSLFSSNQEGAVQAIEGKAEEIKNQLAQWTASLSTTREEILAAFEIKSKDLADNFDKAGNIMLDNINMRSTDIIMKMQDAGGNVVEQLSAANKEMSDKIHMTSVTIVDSLLNEVKHVKTGLDNATVSLTQTLGEHSTQMLNTLTKTGAEVSESIALKANEVNQTLKHTGDSLVLDLGLRGAEVTQKLDETGVRIAEFITDKGSSLADRISETGNKLYETINVNGVQLDKNLAATGISIAENLAVKMKEAQEAMHSQATAYNEDFKGMTVGLIDNFSLKTTDLQDKITELASNYHQKVSETSNLLVGELDKRYSDLDRVINVNGSAVAAQFATTANEVSSTIKGHMSVFDQSFTGFDEKGKNIVAEIMKVTDALSSSLETRGASLISEISKVTDVVTNSLETRGATITEAITAKSVEATKALAASSTELVSSLQTTSDTTTSSLKDTAIAIATLLKENSDLLTSSIKSSGEDMVKAIEEKSASTVSNVTSSTNNIFGALQMTQEKLGGNMKELLEAISITNENFNTISSKAQTSLTDINSVLVNSTAELNKVVENVAIAADSSVGALDSKVEALKNISSGTITTLSDISQKVGSQTAELGKLSEFFEQVQVKFNSVIDERRAKLDQVVEHIGDKTTSLDQMVARLNENLTKQLDVAQARSQELIVNLTAASQAQAQKMEAHLGLLNSAHDMEKASSNTMMQQAYDTTVVNINQLYQDSAAKFNELTGQLRQVSASIANELEATRAELKRSLIDLPRETSEQASNMRRVVSEQIGALAELNEIIQQSGKSFGVAEPAYSNAGARYDNRRFEPQALASNVEKVSEPIAPPIPVKTYDEPAPKPRQKPQATQPVTRNETFDTPLVAEPSFPRKDGDGWLSGLLARASKVDEEITSFKTPKKSQTNSTLLDEIPAEIQSLVNHQSVIDLWDKYRRGEEHAFDRSLYTKNGQRRFDEVNALYKTDAHFRANCDRFVDDFERMLSEVNRDSRDPNVTRNMLISDTGKTYTLLAHASGRFEFD